MALPKSTCPISDTRKKSLSNFWKSKIHNELYFCWKENKHILDSVSGINTLKKLAKRNIPGVRYQDTIIIPNPDTFENEIVLQDYLNRIHNASYNPETHRLNLENFSNANSYYNKLVGTLTFEEFEMPKVILNSNSGAQFRVILLTEDIIKHIFYAEEVYKRVYRKTSRCTCSDFWNYIIYRNYFGYNSYYIQDSFFEEDSTEDNCTFVCNLSKYLSDTLDMFSNQKSVSKIEYFTPDSGVITDLQAPHKDITAFILLKTPEEKTFIEMYKDILIKNSDTKVALDYDINNSSVFKTLINKPRGQEWLKYFTLADYWEENSSSSVFYSKDSVERAIIYLKSLYNPEWSKTLNSLDVLGIANGSYRGSLKYMSYFVKTKIFEQLAPWLGMIRKTIQDSEVVKDNANLAKDYPNLPRYTHYFITLGYKDCNDFWMSNIRFKNKFLEPILAMGSKYSDQNYVEFLPYCGDWNQTSLCSFGPSHTYFEKMFFLPEVMNELAFEIKKFEEALITISQALNVCRILDKGYGKYLDKTDAETIQIIWDGLQDYFRSENPAKKKSIEQALELQIENFTLDSIPDPFEE